MTEANQEQAEYWNGPEIRHWVDNDARYDEMLAGFGARLLAAGRVGPTDAVLDIGCGCGAITLASARSATDGSATGVDISNGMVTRARERARAAGLTNAFFEVADAQTHSFSREFDLVTSRFGVMFFDDPVAAFTNVRNAMADGARLAFMCWQPAFENEWMMVPIGAALEHLPPPELPPPDTPGPFALADRDRVQQILGDAGWSSISIEPAQERVLLGGRGSVDDAMRFILNTGMGRGLMADADPDAAARAVDAIRAALAPHHNGEGVELSAAGWLVTGRA